MLSKKILEKINLAREYVKNLDEPFDKLAFQAVLEHLLSSGTDQEIAQSKKSWSHAEFILKSQYVWDLRIMQRLKPLLQNLYILKIAQTEFQIDSLSSSDIQIILSEKFSISKSANAISMSLMKVVGRYVDKIQDGKKFLYKLLPDGIKYLDSQMPYFPPTPAWFRS